MFLSKHFELEEFVHPDIFHKIGDRSMDFLHPHLALTCQSIKDMLTKHLGNNEPVTINDWSWGGNFRSSGLRLPKGDVGAALSSHRFGTAADLKFKNITPIEVQRMILDRADEYVRITRMENAEVTKTWLHIEVGSQINGSIKVFNP